MNTIFKGGIHFIYSRCIQPKSIGEDNQRHEFILNIILSASIALIGLLDIFILTSWIKEGAGYRGAPFYAFTILLAIFIGLLILSRRKHFPLAAYILLGLYYASATYCTIAWGVELPLAGFGYALTIIMASVLVSTRFGFVTTLIIALTLLGVGYAQVHGLTMPELFWKSEPIDMEDPTELSIILGLIMTISWLSNREIESSLRRARRSESSLKEERDNLEIKVEERTRELKHVQREKITQLYRFAEFGKLSSGIFHDLMNSLNAVVANVSQLEHSPEELPEVKAHLVKAVGASKRMGDFLATARKQMQTTCQEDHFSLNKEVREVIDMLEYHARESGLSLKVKDPREIIMYGNALRFHQIAVNLITNAIDACSSRTNDSTIINISLTRQDDAVVFRVTDHGCGIPTEFLERIFDPFFTTKGAIRGIGLGLSMTKDIVEKDFRGTIAVQSEEGKGSSFTIIFPIVNEKKTENCHLSGSDQ